MTSRPFLLCALGLALASTALSETRSWTNSQGKQIQAQFVGLKDGNVTLLLTSGQTATVPLAGLSAEDRKWVQVNVANTVAPPTSLPPPADAGAGRVPWDKRRTPTEVKEPMLYMNIKVVKEEPGECIYESGHFQFKSSAKLGSILMKDVCRAFESTYELVRMMPWGIVPKPEEGRTKFQAELYATRAQYLATGAPSWSAGVYVRKDKVFRMPFSELGISDTVGANGAYYRKGEVNNDTITHEITHQMMHEYLPCMPVWLIEGLAEYTSNLPYKGGVFSVASDSTAFVVKQTSSRNRGLFGAMRQKPLWLGTRDMWSYTTDISKRNPIRSFTLSDKEEAEKETRVTFNSEQPPSMAELGSRYYSSHILAYYFVHENGGKRLMQYFDAVYAEQKKWPAFWAQVDAHNAALDKLRPAYDAYRAAMKEFMQKPGVKDLGNGRFSYPNELTPPAPPPDAPKSPEPPDNTNPDAVCVKHLGILLGDRSLETIEQELKAMFQQRGLTL